ncbi:MAG TPA: putative Ig domain-containing protein [Pyrinomonadaceae bacterium]
MQLQRVIRAVTCAALCAVLVASAMLFPAQTVIGQETNSNASGNEAAVGQSQQNVQDQGLRAALEQARYSITRAANTPLGRWAWYAPNPAAGYDAYITEEGVTIVVNGQPCVSLRLRGFGYGTGLRAIAPGQVSADKQTINLTRDGSVQEWFVNSPDGLEQGFTFAEAPAGRRPNVPLRLAFKVGEGEQATASADGWKVMLRGANGSHVVEYGKLAAHDRTGRDVPARLTADGDEVFIEVEDGDATYPLTIDPVFTLQEKLPAEDSTQGDGFGSALALSGDTAVIGAYMDGIGSNINQGSVYVFTRAHGVWSLQQKLTASDGKVHDQFGGAVALSGDTLVVGVQNDPVSADYNQGSAYVFTRSDGVWTEQQKLTAPDGQRYDLFGCAVAVSGDMVVVGARGDTVGSNYQQGSAYFFTRAGGVWTFQQKLTAPNGIGDAYDSYGNAVAINEGTLAVGSYLTDVGILPNHGAVYIYARGHTGWVQEKRLVAADRDFGDAFGVSVALSGETLAVGALWDDIDEHGDQGSVYVFTRGGGAWPQQQKLTAADGAAADQFGSSLALDGDTLVAGASRDDVGENQDQGSAYVFTRGDAVWTEQQRLNSGDGVPWGYFGERVAVSGGTALLSGASAAVGGDYYQGSVYFFRLPTCPTLMFKPLELPNGVSGVVYEQAVTMSGGAGPYEFMQLAGSLPPGVSLSPSGVLSGTPATAGTYHFTLLATDTGSGCGSVRDYTLTVD